MFGTCFVSAGVLIGLRFLYLSLKSGDTGHVQSLILAAILIIIGVYFAVIGILADLIAVNRQLLEKLDWRTQTLEERLVNYQRDK
jgi:hypothetical protein